MNALLSIRNLHTTIFDGEPPVKAVDGVSLDIERGEMIALAGESGCGKSMLALSIGQLLPPAAKITRGEIFFQGTDLSKLTQTRLAAFRGGKIAYVFQDPMGALNPVITIGSQLAETVQLHRKLSGQALEDRCLELLKQVRMPLPEERLNQYPHQLSGGMRQRVMIAMALAGSPSLLVADEPTTALDVTTQAEILDLIRNLQIRLRMSVLMITHDLGAVAPFSDRTAIMYAGRIVEIARTKELLTHALHPYTQALLKCIPRVGAGRQRLDPVPGSVPDLREKPAGCPFHPRCLEAAQVCSQQEPALEPLKGRAVSCWMRRP